MYKITVSGPVEFELVANSELFVGAKSSLLCVEGFGNHLRDLEISGGAVEIRKHAERGIIVATEYVCSTKLTRKDLDLLVRETTAQWLDGVGEGCFDDLALIHGEVNLAPRDTENQVVIEQERIDKTKKKLGNIENAVRKADLDLIQELIANGCDLAAKNKTGNPPLHQALLSGRKDVVVLLTESGAPLELLGMDGYDVFCCLGVSNKVDDALACELAKYLLSKGAKLRPDTPEDESPLFWALNRAKKKFELVLREAGATESWD